MYDVVDEMKLLGLTADHTGRGKMRRDIHQDSVACYFEVEEVGTQAKACGYMRGNVQTEHMARREPCSPYAMWIRRS